MFLSCMFCNLLAIPKNKKELCIFIRFGVQLWIELIVFEQNFTEFRPKNYDLELYTRSWPKFANFGRK